MTRDLLLRRPRRKGAPHLFSALSGDPPDRRFLLLLIFKTLARLLDGVRKDRDNARRRVMSALRDFGEKLRLQNVSYPDIATLEGIFNTHVHPRDDDEEKDGRTELVMPLFADVYEVINGIGNTASAILTADRALKKGERWRSFVPPGRKTRVLVAMLLTEHTDPEDVARGYEKGAFDALKVYIRGASNDGGHSVDDITKILATLKVAARKQFGKRPGPIPVQLHLERKYTVFGDRIQMAERERASIERDLFYITREVPEGCYIVCHVSDASTLDAIRFLRRKGIDIYGEIALQYTCYTHEDLFEDGNGGTGFNSKLFCVPIFKFEDDRRRIDEAMVSDEDCWIYGKDDACQVDGPLREKGVKINRNGIVIGGQTSYPEADISYCIEKFVAAGALYRIDEFLNRRARKIFHLPPSEIRLTFRRQDWTVPETIERESPHHGRLVAQVAMGKETRRYRLAA